MKTYPTGRSKAKGENIVSTIFITSAPANYDWGWTRDVRISGDFVDQRGRPARFVQIDEFHAESQVARYASGLYPTQTLKEFIMDTSKYPTFIPR